MMIKPIYCACGKLLKTRQSKSCRKCAQIDLHREIGLTNWTPQDLELLELLYPYTPNSVISKKTGISIARIERKAHSLNYHKNKAAIYRYMEATV